MLAITTCYTSEEMEELARMAEQMAEGSVVVTMSKALVSSKFEVRERHKLELNCGTMQVIIQQRV